MFHTTPDAVGNIYCKSAL